MLERKASIKNVDSYQGSRLDILKKIKKPFKVLDVGCNQGATILNLKEKFPYAKCWGIDINTSALSKAMPFLEDGWCLNLDDYSTLKKELSGLHFDTIIAADVLEHTLDPKRIVDILYGNLCEGGTIYISLPNVAHWEIVFHLLNQKWPYRERGIFDNTHYNFFMLKNLYKLSPIGSKFVLLDRNYRVFESNKLPQLNFALSPFTKLISFIPWLREYFVFQYIIAIKKPKNIK